jgi:hypothetical protein
VPGALRERLESVGATLSGPGLARVALEWSVRRRYLVFERNLTGAGAPVAELPASWEVLQGEGLAALREVNPAVDIGKMRRRDQAGHFCYAFRHEGRLVHYRWYALLPVYLSWLGLSWQPVPGDVLIFDGFTHPAVRGQRVATIISSRESLRARELGLTRSLAFVAWWNEASLRLLQRHRYRQVGAITRWRILAKWHTASGSARLGDGTVTIEPSAGPD